MKTPLGYNAIVEDQHRGLLYHSGIGAPLRSGDKMQAFVTAIREDGKIDLSLDRSLVMCA